MNNTNTNELDHDPRIIRKYHPRAGLAYFSLDTNDFLYGEDGKPIFAGEKVTRCPQCGAVKRVKR